MALVVGPPAVFVQSFLVPRQAASQGEKNPSTPRPGTENRAFGGAAVACRRAGQPLVVGQSSHRRPTDYLHGNRQSDGWQRPCSDWHHNFLQWRHDVGIGKSAKQQFRPIGRRSLQWQFPDQYRQPRRHAHPRALSFWVETDASANYPNVLATSGGEAGNQGFRFEEHAGGFLEAVIGNDSQTYQTHVFTNTGFSAGNWYNVVLCWNTTTDTVQGYFDGTLAFNDSQSYWPSALGDVQVGTGWYSRNWLGSVDELMFFNRNLTTSEIAGLYNGGAGSYGPPSSASANLVAGYHFDGDTSDFSGNGHNGTAQGTLTFVPGIVSNPAAIPTATFTTSSLPAGNDMITANYGGDANYSSGVSSALDEAVASQTVFWDPSKSDGINLGGSGTWIAGGNTDCWYLPGTGDVAWTNNDNVVFSGTAGEVTVSGTVAPNSITFNTTSYVLSGGTLSLPTGGGAINVASGLTDTIQSVVSGGGPVVAGGGTVQLTATIPTPGQRRSASAAPSSLARNSAASAATVATTLPPTLGQPTATPQSVTIY